MSLLGPQMRMNQPRVPRTAFVQIPPPTQLQKMASLIARQGGDVEVFVSVVGSVKDARVLSGVLQSGTLAIKAVKDGVPLDVRVTGAGVVVDGDAFPGVEVNLRRPRRPEQEAYWDDGMLVPYEEPYVEETVKLTY